MAESLVAASLRGVDSHGFHLLPHYLDQIAAGDVNPLATGEIVTNPAPAWFTTAKTAWGK